MSIHTSGAGIDDENIFDRYEEQMGLLGHAAERIHRQTKQMVGETWRKQLETQ